ncbi:hypothetical protein ES703_25697 [subsurface metagenome]
MARKVTEDDITRWKELRDKGYTYERIGKETKWGSETVRKHIGGEKKPPGKEKEEPEADLELQARAFLRFEQGKGPTDLVEEKICTVDVAKALWEKFRELRGESKLRIEKLDKIVGYLCERVSKLEGFCATTLTDAWECPACKVVGKVAVRFKCTACEHENWMGYQPEKKPESIYK